MTVMTDIRLGIELGVWHGRGCADFATPLYDQLSSGKYDVCATMSLPANRGAWEEQHRTSRKRAWRAERLGYAAGRINRQDWTDDIHAINTSRDYRQGRPMTSGYLERPPASPLPDYPCGLHAVRAYGVLEMEPVRLVAYLYMYRSGDLALVSQVLGHAAHEDNGVMHLLFRHALEAEGQIAPGVCVYNRWDSGTDGLRQLKSWVGFEETAVEWLP